MSKRETSEFRTLLGMPMAPVPPAASQPPPPRPTAGPTPVQEEKVVIAAALVEPTKPAEDAIPSVTFQKADTVEKADVEKADEAKKLERAAEPEKVEKAAGAERGEKAAEPDKVEKVGKIERRAKAKANPSAPKPAQGETIQRNRLGMDTLKALGPAFVIPLARSEPPPRNRLITPDLILAVVVLVSVLTSASVALALN